MKPTAAPPLRIEDPRSAVLKKFDWPLFFILLLAAAVLLFDLGRRVLHQDEGGHGFELEEMLVNGVYKYNSKAYHGPIQFYVYFVFVSLFGKDGWVLRLPIALLGLLNTYLVSCFGRYIGRRAALLGALAMAVSPALVYFSRFVDNDIGMVFFSLLIIRGFFGLWKEGKSKYLWYAGFGLVGMIVLKETFVINVAGMVAATGYLWVFRSTAAKEDRFPAPQKWTPGEFGLVVLSCLFIVVLLYSGMFRNFPGIPEFFKSFLASCKIGTEISTQPPNYWLKLLMTHEPAGVIGLLAMLFYAFLPGPLYVRWLALYGLFSLAVYSAIPYKTPWLCTNFVWPMLVLFGSAADLFLKLKAPSGPKAPWPRTILQSFYRRLAVYRLNMLQRSCLLAVPLLVSAAFAIRVSFFPSEDYAREPFYHSQTPAEVFHKTVKPLFRLAAIDPSAYRIRGYVQGWLNFTYYWQTNDFTNIVHDLDQSALTIDLDYVLVKEESAPSIESKLGGPYFRDGVTLWQTGPKAKMYLKYDTFKKVFPERRPEYIPDPKRTLMPDKQGSAP